MGKWVKTMLRRIGLAPRSEPPAPERREEEMIELTEAQRRIAALDVRVEVLTRRASSPRRDPR